MALPFEQVRKWKKKCPLSEPQASFGHFPFFDLLKREPEGQRLCGRLLLLTFLGEARKVSSRRSTTGRQSRQTTSVIQRKNGAHGVPYISYNADIKLLIRHTKTLIRYKSIAVIFLMKIKTLMKNAAHH
ncbi:hypothetical protein [Undibacterium sp. Xuan67W]|uniref:hypothetical protein n=1 Tax=Undibacterium sp. Xuan67W TaxID=3413057 RepID=UPI003BF289E2